MGMVGHHIVNFFHHLRVFHMYNTAQRIWLRILWYGCTQYWLCLIRSLTLFNNSTITIWSCLTVFLCFCIFSILWLNLFFSQDFSTVKRQAKDIGVGGFHSGKAPEGLAPFQYFSARDWNLDSISVFISYLCTVDKKRTCPRFLFFIFVFCLFLGPHPRYMEFPRLGV